jgi:hypothetical protein
LRQNLFPVSSSPQHQHEGYNPMIVILLAQNFSSLSEVLFLLRPSYFLYATKITLTRDQFKKSRNGNCTVQNFS